jgi:hypothetical protein
MPKSSRPKIESNLLRHLATGAKLSVSAIASDGACWAVTRKHLAVVVPELIEDLRRDHTAALDRRDALVTGGLMESATLVQRGIDVVTEMLTKLDLLQQMKRRPVPKRPILATAGATA